MLSFNADNTYLLLSCSLLRGRLLGLGSRSGLLLLRGRLLGFRRQLVGRLDLDKSAVFHALLESCLHDMLLDGCLWCEGDNA